MLSPPSKNNKIILASIGNKQSVKRTEFSNTSAKRTQSNERRLQTLEPEANVGTAINNGNGINNNNVYSKPIYQLPASAMGQSNHQKRKLFSNLNNCTPKSPASIYATITGPSTTTAATASSSLNNNSSSSRHSKITKLNNFFEQRKYNGVAAGSAKKNRITNENMIENINRQKFQIGNSEMEEESPLLKNNNNNTHHQQQQPHHYPQHHLQLLHQNNNQQHNNQMGNNNSSSNYSQDLIGKNDSVDAEFNKTIKEFRKQVKQNQMNQLSNLNQAAQKITFPPVPSELSTFPTTPNMQNQDSYEQVNNNNNTNNCTPNEKVQQGSHQQNSQISGLNSYVTRINKGEMMSGMRQSYSSNGNSQYNQGNSNNTAIIGSSSQMSSPTNNSTNHQLNYNTSTYNQYNLMNQQTTNQQQYLSSLVQLNLQQQNTPNASGQTASNMNKLYSSNDKKTNKEIMLLMNSKFKKTDSFKISKGKQDYLSTSSNSEALVSGGSVRSSLSKPLSKKSGRQTTSSVRTSSSMKSKSKKATPLKISLDHTVNQQTLNTSTTLAQTATSPQHARQLTNTHVESMSIDIEEHSSIPSEHPPSTLPPNLRNLNLDDIFLHKQKNSIKNTHYYNTPMIGALKTKVSTDQYFDSLFKEHFIQSFHSLNFCKNLKPIPNHILNSKKINLPIHSHNQGKKTLVFDLDETLIHCNESTDLPADVIIPIKFPNNDVIDAGINVRPHAKECLEELSKHFEIIVFTASHGCYAVKVLQYLDPEDKYISHKLFRESCVQSEEGIHIKDMRIFQNRNIKDIVLIDNAAYSFCFQIENGIPIIPYYDNKNDQELKHLTTYIMNNLLDCSDVREINKQYFKMHLHQYSDKIEHAVKKIYNF